MADLQYLGKLVTLISTLFAALCGSIIIVGACKKHTSYTT
jgi:hypothetical protein